MQTPVHDDDASILIDHQHMVKRVVTEMRTNPEPLTLEDLADLAGLSPFYFSRIFRDVTGIPPGEFATSIRFERAKELLLTTPASVTDICFEVGYGSLGTFSSRFKELVGATPAAFRELPDILAGTPLRSDAVGIRAALRHSPTSVQVTMEFPPDRDAYIFVGVYPANIAASRPIVGQMVTEPGPIVFPRVPVGTWVVLSAAMPSLIDPVRHLVPRGDILVARSEPFRMSPDDPRPTVHLKYFSPGPFEPPVLTALVPGLLQRG